MIDSKGFGTKVGIIGTGRGLYTASLFVLNIGLARTLGTLGYGSFQQVFIFNALFMIFSLGIPDTLYYFLPRLKKENISAFIGQTLFLLGISGIAVAALLFFGAHWFSSLQGNPGIEKSLKFFGIYGAFIIGSAFADPIFMIFGKVKYLFILSMLHAIFFVGLTAWCFFKTAPVEYLFLSMAIFGFIKYIFSWLLLGGIKSAYGGPKFSFKNQSFLLQLGFAIPVALSNGIDIISRWLDKFVVSFFLGTEPLGIFSVGALEIPFIGILVSTVYGLISPKLNTLHEEGNTDGFIELVRKTLQLTSKIIWPVFAYLFVFAGNLITLVFSNQYEGAVLPFRIYLTLLPIRIFLFGVILLALGKPRLIFTASLLTLFINLVLNVILVIKMGYIGAAASTVISTYLQAAILIWFIISELKTGLADIVPFRTLYNVAILSLISVGITYVFSKGFHSDLLIVLVSMAVFFIVYYILSYRAGFWGEDKFLFKRPQ